MTINSSNTSSDTLKFTCRKQILNFKHMYTHFTLSNQMLIAIDVAQFLKVYQKMSRMKISNSKSIRNGVYCVKYGCVVILLVLIFL